MDRFVRHPRRWRRKARRRLRYYEFLGRHPLVRRFVRRKA